MKILLADDDPVFQVMLGRTLSKWGYQTMVLGDGESALQHLRALDGPSIAILDWMMPRLNGLDVCRAVRALNLGRYVYLILLTSKRDSEDLMSGLDAGADDYLSKPIHLDELRHRLRAACRVLEAESRHRHIAESASDGIVTIEKGNRIHYANDAAGAIFGYPRADLLGLNFAELVPDFELRLRSRTFEPVEILGKQRHGGSIVLEISISEAWHIDQERVLTAVIRDITERRRSEGQRSQAQKLESIGQLAAGVAHEINTPIQYIGDNLQFLKDSWGALETTFELHRETFRELSGGASTAIFAAVESAEQNLDFEYLQGEVPRAIGQALEGVQHVASIVRAMKEFAHPGTKEKVPTDLNHLIETIVLVSRNQWKYVADLKLDLDPGLPLVPCVGGEISQVVLNLIVNAVDAISDASASREDGMGTVTIATRTSARFAELRISDTGTGIPADVQSRVFDPFFTTKDIGKGSGQGLSLAYTTVVQRHQGSISFDTTIGAGTTFLVQLPLSVPELAIAPATPATARVDVFGAVLSEGNLDEPVVQQLK